MVFKFPDVPAYGCALPLQLGVGHVPRVAIEPALDGLGSTACVCLLVACVSSGDSCPVDNIVNGATHSREDFAGVRILSRA